MLVNAGQLHLDMGEIDRALAEALKAYTLGRDKHDQILMARSRILEAFAENARVDEQLGEDGDTAVYANAAQRYAEEAVDAGQAYAKSALVGRRLHRARNDCSQRLLSGVG